MWRRDIDHPEINPLQAMMDGMSANWQKTRVKTQMTLGQLISALETLSPNKKVTGFGTLDSYRGYYCDLSFCPTNEVGTARALLERCVGAMGKTFTGYKGGEFMMGEDTPLWISKYGECSNNKLMALDLNADPIQPVLEQESE